MLVNFKFYGLFFLMIVSFLFAIKELYQLVNVDLKNFNPEKERLFAKVYMNSFVLYFLLGSILMKIIENYEQLEPFF